MVLMLQVSTDTCTIRWMADSQLTADCRMLNVVLNYRALWGNPFLLGFSVMWVKVTEGFTHMRTHRERERDRDAFRNSVSSWYTLTHWPIILAVLLFVHSWLSVPWNERHGWHVSAEWSEREYFWDLDTGCICHTSVCAAITALVQPETAREVGRTTICWLKLPK